MKAAIRARLAKLEAGRRASGRLGPIFISGDPRTDFEAEIAFQKAEMIRAGQAAEHDEFLVFKTIYEDAPHSACTSRSGRATRTVAESPRNGYVGL